MKALFKSGNSLIYDTDFIDAIKQSGIKNGDIICVHSEIFSFGISAVKKDELLSALIDCFYEVIREDGTLIMPTFTYSFCKNEIYDKVNSKSTIGILTEYFRTYKNPIRTNDPIFSFAINGKNANIFLKDTKTCFDKNSVYDVLRSINGKIVLFGNKTRGFTFTHYIEKAAKVSYRYYKTFSGIMIDENGKKIEKSIDYYVRKLDEKSIFNIQKQILLLQKTDNFNTVNIGNGTITSIDAKRYFNDTISALKNDNFCCKPY
ncbi:aminoglycoside N(3)-acetyltransferase [Campylobacter sp. RM12327]|uniref:AAC(3) family N-acetyltransferase n=1 Tax=Campylobacter sputorum TaxID=206 RepID=UPI000B784A24|nr:MULTISPECIES: AAC(3) family N-acetyltransferase [Campylobacter]ASM40735.1 aminoglycoside N3'-acetyltransferase [Campylobacter sputorum]MBE7357964.1 aminoglycoside N(3)-acetyltransferase [Campylobacter sp. RM11302]MBF6669634.1 aminoglycoside N(3)-acetyltransferase [Campylobacter sp. RM12327]MBF6674894.1 aminoglycoside N(3)-acetyltransferase [Campylobacter sp. RM13538]MBF6676527.1 aminoglycoside N(3)-acetyltransferase [Campylobacter sp. RM12321]